jgi:hypothetical protein
LPSGLVEEQLADDRSYAGGNVPLRPAINSQLRTGTDSGNPTR